MAIDDDARPELVRYLIHAGANINAKTKEGDTVLFSAVDSVDSGVFAELLTAGADVNAANKNGETPLMRAVSRDKIDIVQLLLDRGADVNAIDKNGESAWDKSSNARVDEMLLAAGAKVSYDITVEADADAEPDDGR